MLNRPQKKIKVNDVKSNWFIFRDSIRVLVTKSKSGKTNFDCGSFSEPLIFRDNNSLKGTSLLGKPAFLSRCNVLFINFKTFVHAWILCLHNWSHLKNKK